MNILLFRMLLTRESFVIQMIVMEVLKQIMKAAQEDLTERKKVKLEGRKLRILKLGIFYI